MKAKLEACCSNLVSSATWKGDLLNPNDVFQRAMFDQLCLTSIFQSNRAESLGLSSAFNSTLGGRRKDWEALASAACEAAEEGLVTDAEAFDYVWKLLAGGC